MMLTDNTVGSVEVLKTAAAAYLHRDKTVFVFGNFDLLLLACEFARLSAERSIDLECTKKMTTLSDPTIKKIVRGYVDGVAIRFMSRQTFDAINEKTWNYPVMVQSGYVVDVYGADESDVTVLAYTWMPSYLGEEGVKEDVLIGHGFDWMLYKVVQSLNVFAKEDERVAITDKMLDEAWQGIVNWNTTMMEYTNDDMSM